jgi:hypothetical protein
VISSSSSYCLSCANSNYYLKKATSSVSYGQCELKEDYGTFVHTIYVNYVGLASNANVQSQTGEYAQSTAFEYLQDAIKRAYELSANFRDATVTIVLKNDPLAATTYHAMIRKNDGYYMPIRNDDWSQNVKLTITSEDTTKPVTVRYKLRDTFKFLVGGGLTIKYVNFDAGDSLMTPVTASTRTKLADPTTTYCQTDAAGNLLTTYTDCVFTRKP